MWLPALIANLVKHRERRNLGDHGCLTHIPVGVLGLTLLFLGTFQTGFCLALSPLPICSSGWGGVCRSDMDRYCGEVYRRPKGPLFRLNAGHWQYRCFGIGFFVKWVLDNDRWVFPANYGILCDCLHSIHGFLASLILVKEPLGKAYEEAGLSASLCGDCQSTFAKTRCF